MHCERSQRNYNTHDLYIYLPVNQNYSSLLYSFFDKVYPRFEVPHNVFEGHVQDVYHHVVKFLTD